MNKKRFPVLLVAILYIATKVSCQESTSVFNFLSLPYSAHVTGLGGHNISLIEDDIPGQPEPILALQRQQQNSRI